MSWQTPLLQIIALLVGLIVVSFLPIPYLGVVIATVRLLLVMELGVALVYLGVLLRRQESQAVVVHQDDAEARYGIERGK